MSIPATISTALTSLEAQVTAATPLANASHATIVALQLNAANLVALIQTTLITPNNTLDFFIAPVDPVAIINGVEGVYSAGQDQYNLCIIRGVVGRATSNLDQLT